MSHKRAKKLRTLGFHVEYGGNWPAMERSRAAMDAMRPTPKELRRVEAYKAYKIRQLLNKETKFNRGTHEGCSCPPEDIDYPCRDWLHNPDRQ
ncbi:hypothetical protein [Myxococcus phage Mx1]|nr:hypothetical protein [Myxococcus phage Mx1]